MGGMVFLEASPVVSSITTAAASLTTDLAVVIPIAIGVGVLVFGAKYLWRTGKSLIGS